MARIDYGYFTVMVLTAYCIPLSLLQECRHTIQVVCFSEAMSYSSMVVLLYFPTHRRGVLSEAALALEAEVTAHPNNAEAWRLLGTVHAENDDDLQVCVNRVWVMWECQSQGRACTASTSLLDQGLPQVVGHKVKKGNSDGMRELLATARMCYSMLLEVDAQVKDWDWLWGNDNALGLYLACCRQLLPWHVH
jgi:hypothetical protein